MVKLYTVLVRKPCNYEQLLKDEKELITKYHTKPEEFKIETIIELSKEEFAEFKNNLLADRDYIENAEGIFLVKEKGTEDMKGLIVDAQGFSYARYVGIPVEEVKIKKCPHCSKYYLEPSAISRADNKTEICSDCGVKEALEAYGIDKGMLDFLKNAQETSDKYKVKVVVSVSESNDIVIEPNK
jgi:predicted RNA-binding Zn-ribbon protein involved in translation (DUF1610 family)